MILRLQLVLFFVLLIAHSLSSRQVRRRRLRRQVVSEAGLYGKETKVFVLNTTNFDSVYGTKNAWLVEFYANWCGHCQRFAPVYTALAKDTEGWKDVVEIAAFDCAATINNGFCRDHEITHYPTLKFFHDNSPKDYRGMELTKRKDEVEIRQTIVSFLIKEQEEGRGKTWPDLSPQEGGSDRVIWENVEDAVKHQVIVSEDGTSVLGAEVILDLHKRNDVLIKRFITDKGAPSVVIFNRNGTQKSLDSHGNTREAYVKAIKNYLDGKDTDDPTENRVETHGDILMPNNAPDKVHAKSDILYQVDLENAVRYSLKREVPIQNSIDGESLEALKNYLEVLAKYFPVGKNGVRFLESLRGWVTEQPSVAGKAFSDHVDQLLRDMAPVFRSRIEWLGCKGSTDKYRGYPCGVWTLFHTLTTNAVLESGDSRTYNSREVLDAMVGYIKYFFGCNECSQHFQQMAEESLNGNVTNPDDSILWLWRAHNNVNRRLAGDITEDPKHPKVQFPSDDSCPTCRDESGEWIDNQVLAFLKQMYGKYNINYSHWNVTLVEPELLPAAESQAPDDSNSGSSLWSYLCLPLFLTALTTIGVLLYFMCA